MIKLIQVNIRLPEPSADRLKGMAEQAGLKIGPFVEKLLELYKPDSNLLQNDSNAAIEELREIVASQTERLDRMEQAIIWMVEAVNLNSGEPEPEPEPEPAEAEKNSPSHPAKPLSPTAPEFNQDKDQFRAAVIELYQQGETNRAEILRILTNQGYRNLEGKGYYRNDVMTAINRAKKEGLVE